MINSGFDYKYIADAIREEAKVRLLAEPKLLTLLRALYAVKLEVSLMVGDMMSEEGKK